MRPKKTKRSKVRSEQVKMQEDATLTDVSTIILTQHAIKRAHERLNWNKEKLQSVIIKIIHDQVDIQQFQGRLRRYLKGRINAKSAANYVCLFGDILFFFKDNYLITLFRIPEQYLSELGLGDRSVFSRACISNLADLL